MPHRMRLFGILLLATSLGCTSARDWVHNNLKVGPEYARPGVPLQPEWIEAGQPQVDVSVGPNDNWWYAFNDPILNDLVLVAYQRNLDLRNAGLRVLEARYQRAIAAANLLPQQQAAFGRYTRNQISRGNRTGFNAIPGFPIVFAEWQFGFDLGWELDLWGRIRRQVASADAQLDASIEDYDAVMVTLIADVAQTYLEIRGFDERLEYARQNVELQQNSLDFFQKRWDAGLGSNTPNAGDQGRVNLEQLKQNVANTRALIPLLQRGRRLASNRLAILLGMTPPEVMAWVGEPANIPVPPAEVAAGIPADLLRRRPDIRAAERRVAAQSELIGVAEAELYPQFSIAGDLGWQANVFKNVFNTASVRGSIVPQFRWNILNYGRLRNNVRVQETRFQQAITNYEFAVLNAQREVEDAIAESIYSTSRLQHLTEATGYASEALKYIRTLAQAGTVDVNQVFVIQSTLVTQQDQQVQEKVNVAQSIVRVYRALGGGWQLRMQVPNPNAIPAGGPEEMPAIPENQPVPPVLIDPAPNAANNPM